MKHHGSDEFAILSEWLGWGDPIGGLWCVGVEEGGTWGCSSPEELGKSRAKICQLSGEAHTPYMTPESRGDIKWPIAVVTAKIAAGISRSGLDWREYRERLLWLSGSGVFNGNLLPLGKPRLGSAHWPEGYNDLFGFNYNDYAIAFAEIKEKRKASFKRFANESGPHAIVCFGMSNWDDFTDFFVSNPGDHIAFEEDKTIVYGSDRVILTRHFSNGMSDRIVTRIINQLESWDVSLR